MKARRFLLPLALMLISPVRADQGSIVTPIAGPMTMADYAARVNAGFLALQSCNSGTLAPTNGPGSAPKAFQCWADTSASPTVTYKTYDGASWVAFGKLNTTTHIWTPVYQGTDVGTASTAATGTSGHTLGFLDGANTWSAVQSFNSAMLSLKGSTSGAGTLNAPAIASAYVWTLPAATGTLADLALAQTFTNKTFNCANNVCTVRLASDVTGVLPAANGGTGVANAYNLTLANPLTTSGAAPLTFTVTGTTNSTLPAGNHTLSALDVVETWTGAKTFASGKLLLAGSTSGAGTLNAPAVAGSYVWTLPALNGTLITADATKTLTNTTLDTAGTGNSFLIAGLAATANTGTGAVVRATSPMITTPTGIVKGDVGLGNVDNTSDTTKNAATATLMNKTLTAPVINSPTGIVKGDVGLGNVDNTSDINKPVSTAQAAADALKVNLTRNVAAGCGLTGGGDLSADRTLRSIQAINAQTGTSYILITADCGRLVTFSNAAAQAVTLDSTLGSGYWTEVSSLAAGVVTLTPSSGNIDGAANLTLSQGDGVRLILDGTNWRSVRGRAGGAGGTVSSVFTRTGAITAASGDYSAAQIGATGVFYKVNVVKFTTPGTATYTPTTGLVYAIIECLGGGGGGGGAGGGATAGYGGVGGGAGSLSRKVSSASAIGASQSVTVGSGGTAGSSGLTNGGAGADTSVGTLCVGKGGGGGGPYYAGNAPGTAVGGVAGTGDVTGTGAPGGAGWYDLGFARALSGAGGSTLYGGGGPGQTGVSTSVAGPSGTGYGAGGAGGVAATATTVAGGAGAPGIAIITEFLNQ